MMKRWSLVLALLVSLASLAGCGSDVKLNDTPVVDRSTGGTGGAGAGSGGLGSGAGQSTVTPIDLAGPSDLAQGPSGVARIVYFDFDSYAIKSEFQSLIEGNARFLKANPSRSAAIEGHTDQRGGSEYNLALGQRRAEAVKRALVLLGVNDAQLEAVSFGKEKPADPGMSEEAMAQNRRVEISYRR